VPAEQLQKLIEHHEVSAEVGWQLEQIPPSFGPSVAAVFRKYCSKVGALP